MSEPSSPKAILDSRGLRPKKSFGQNFLADANLSRRIAELATTPESGSVAEIGAGLGSLTRPLLERARFVVAIERDRDLVPVLHERFQAQIAAGTLRIEEADAKGSDYVALLSGKPRPHVVCGNLPYQITGPLLEKISGLGSELDRVVLLVQLEVAERLVAAPGTKAWGALSVFIQAGFRPERALVVRRGAFYPQPAVDSAVVVLEPRATPLASETPAFQALVQAAFGKRRKKLSNAWHGVLEKSELELELAAERAAVDLDARGETLDVAAFARMARELGP